MTFINTYTRKLAGAFIARSKVLLAIAGILLLSVLIACAPPEDGDDTYTVGGTVTGHTGEVSLALTYGEKTETLKIEAGTDKFTFDGKLEDNQSFTIAVTAPDGQSCRSSLTEGTIVNANITDISVTCETVPTYSVGGAISGLGDGETVTLTLFPTGGIADDKDVNGDTDETTDDTFTFDTKLANGATYMLTVTTQPAGKACTVTPAGEQTVADGDVTDVTVTCIPVYSVSGAVSGLANGETITLTLFPTGETAEDKVITGDGDVSTADTFAFETRLVAGATYTVTTTSPRRKTCTVAPVGEQTMGDSDVTDVAVTCVLTTYSIGGAVIGAADNSLITITLFHADPTLSIPTNIVTIETTPNVANGRYVFTGIPEYRYYLIVVDSATANEVCIPDYTRIRVLTDIGGIVINCSITPGTTYSIGGTISGLADGETIILTLSPNGRSTENIIITADADAATADKLWL